MGEHSENEVDLVGHGQQPASGAAEDAEGGIGPRLIERDGWLFPEEDTIGHVDILAGLDFLREAVSFCRLDGWALQAGGNVGVYPITLARLFDYVATWEPDPWNFAALLANVKRLGRVNLWASPRALGEEVGECDIWRWGANCGCTYTKPGKGTPVKTLDSEIEWLGERTPVRFIQLDAEGDEIPIIRGAMKVIRKWRPVIMIEDRGHKSVKGQAEGFLRNLGYVMVARSQNDVVMTWS